MKKNPICSRCKSEQNPWNMIKGKTYGYCCETIEEHGKRHKQWKETDDKNMAEMKKRSKK